MPRISITDSVRPSVRPSIRRSRFRQKQGKSTFLEQNIVIGGTLGSLDASLQLYKTVYRSIGLSLAHP